MIMKLLNTVYMWFCSGNTFVNLLLTEFKLCLGSLSLLSLVSDKMYFNGSYEKIKDTYIVD